MGVSPSIPSGIERTYFQFAIESLVSTLELDFRFNLEEIYQALTNLGKDVFYYII
jgi:hypothetical protein